MVRLIKCDKCGTISEDDEEFYAVTCYTGGANEEAEVCPECLPDGIAEALRSVEY